MFSRALLCVAFLIVSSANAKASDGYALAPDATEILFSWEYGTGGTQTASFEQFDGTVFVDKRDLTSSTIDISIDPRSVATGSDLVDDILLSGPFFDVDTHPTIRFVGKEVLQIGPSQAYIIGDLTIKGITKPTVLDAAVHVTDDIGDSSAEIVEIVATASVRRSEWDLGGYVPLTSDAVRITIHTALKRLKSPG